MASDKKKDDEYFNCSEEHEFKYVSDLYIEEEDVYDFLKEKCANKTINYSTHKEVYVMLDDAGFTKID